MCRPRYPWLLRRENDFCERVDGITVVHQVKEHTVVGDLLDCTVDVWVTWGRRWIFGIPLLVLESGIMTLSAAVDDSEVVHNGNGNHLPGQWTCLACGTREGLA